MISVIICTYNGEKYLRQCLESVVNQTIGVENLEIIIIDDASTDTTVEILKEYESKYSENICLILREVNSRETKEDNRNVALGYASGEYILWLDQDDWYELNAIEVLQECVHQYPDMDYIEYGIRYTDAVGNTVGVSCENDGTLYLCNIENEECRNDYARRGILPGATFVWSKIYRRDFLVKNRIYCNDGEQQTGFTDNFFSGLTVLYCRKIGRLDMHLINYRNHIGSWSHDSEINSKVQFERCKAGMAFYNECQQRRELDEKKEMVEYIFTRMFLLKTFWKFLLKFDPIPFDKVQFCQKKMNEYSVRICENSIMKERNDMMLLATALETEWTKEFLIVLRENMISLLNEKKISPVELCVETLC